MSTCPSCGAGSPAGARFCLECGSAIGPDRPMARESRRVVTILFSDIVGSTALGELLDPETLRAVMTRYFDEMTTVIESHGGTVEKYVGDAVMAVFGLPVIHEDDALRAVRAAVGMREALAALNARLEAELGIAIATRTGIETGEVVSGDATARRTLVTGDTVNTAARLEQAAGAGEILLGRASWRLVGDAVIVDPIAPIDARGKAAPVAAVRLVGLDRTPREPVRRGLARLVGRDLELARLVATFEDVLRDRDPALVTLLGPAGVGKSRLVEEFVAVVADRAAVLRGRCLSYGDGITYWPLREILLTAAGIAEDDPLVAARNKLRRLVREARDGPLLAARLASAIGLSAEAAPQEELFWAARRTLEHLAASRPLVIVIEDIHWAEPTLLELIEQLVELVRAVPLLVICPARPELRDIASAWGRGRRHATEIVLDGLSADEMDGLVDSLPGGAGVSGGLRARILATAEGNPLFLEEVVRMLVDDGVVAATSDPRAGAGASDAIRIPPTIGALLAARLDRLPLDERSTAQRASVVGRGFERGAVAALTPSSAEIDLGASLLGLVRRELIAPDRSGLAADEAFTFRHILIRDAAYDTLPKAERAELHERFADWLERASGARLMEFEEILGHHLGLAHRYRTELRDRGERTTSVGARAAVHLIVAGRRARDRGDSVAAAELFRRAEGLPIEDPLAQAELRLHHGLALWDLGRIAESGPRAERALVLANGMADRRLAARARLLRYEVSIADGTFAISDPIVDLELTAILLDAEASGDPLAVALARQALSEKAWNERRFSESQAETLLSVDQARMTGDARFALEMECEILVSWVSGPATASDTVALGERMLVRANDYPIVRARILNGLAIVEAMLGRADDASVHADEAIAIYRDLAQPPRIAESRVNRHWVARLGGDLATAEAELRLVLDGGEVDATTRAFATCRLAEVLVAQGRIDEAERAVVEFEHDPLPVLRPRLAASRARIDASRGDPGAASRVIELLAMVSGTPFINQETDALIEAAEAMASLGDVAAATGHARRALLLAEAKENLALAEQIRVLLARLAS